MTLRKLLFLISISLNSCSHNQQQIDFKIIEGKSTTYIMEDVPVDVIHIRTKLIVDEMDNGLYIRPEKDKKQFCYSRNQISLKHNYSYQFFSEIPELSPAEVISREIGQDTLDYSTLLLAHYGGFGTYSYLGSNVLEVGLDSGEEYSIPLAFDTNKSFYKIIVEDSIKIELINGNCFPNNQYRIEYDFLDCVDSTVVHNAVEIHQIKFYKNVPLPINFQVR